MTLLEMLDALERQIARLRTERGKLAAGLEDAEQRLKAISEAARPAAHPPKRRKSLAGDSQERPSEGAQPATQTGTAEGTGRRTVKRQALGKRLAQLRSH